MRAASNSTCAVSVAKLTSAVTPGARFSTFSIRTAQAAQVLPREVRVEEIPGLVGLLEAACFVVIAYLTGMRTGEVLALEAAAQALIADSPES